MVGCKGLAGVVDPGVQEGRIPNPELPLSDFSHLVSIPGGWCYGVVTTAT